MIDNDEIVYFHPRSVKEVVKLVFGQYHGFTMNIHDIESIKVAIREGKFSYGYDTYGVEITVVYHGDNIVLPKPLNRKQRDDLSQMMEELSRINRNIEIVDAFNLLDHMGDQDIYHVLKEKYNHV